MLPALAAESWLVPLSASEADVARLSVPLGARNKRPLVVALPSASDRPEWQCGAYRHVSSGVPFVLCPRKPDAGLEKIADALRPLLPALKKRFPEHVAPGSIVLAGLGSSVPHAIELARSEPSFFSRLVLVDGALDAFTSPTVVRFARAGGERVLFVCTQRGQCDQRVSSIALALSRAGVQTRVVRLERGAGLDADVATRLRSEWPWVVEGDRRWR